MDEYWGCVQEWWPTIHRAYSDFDERRPVILVVIDEARVYAYSCDEFKNELSARSQDLLDEQYRQAQTRNEIVVFVRDDTARKLVSYNCPWKLSTRRPNKGTPPDRGHGAVRKKRAASRRGRRT
jgi:hypothetical protein